MYFSCWILTWNVMNNFILKQNKTELKVIWDSVIITDLLLTENKTWFIFNIQKDFSESISVLWRRYDLSLLLKKNNMENILITATLLAENVSMLFFNFQIDNLQEVG